MKQVLIGAVAILALFSSCEAADEVFAAEINNVQVAAKTYGSNDYEVYQNIVNTFGYDTQQTHQQNLLRFEQHVNFLMTDKEYVPIDYGQLGLLATATADLVAQLNYSAATKEAVYKILNQSFDPETLVFIDNEQERRLIQTLFAVYSNGSDDDDDDTWNDKRIIAFAYGAQYSFKHAVLYAGAVELMRYQ